VEHSSWRGPGYLAAAQLGAAPDLEAATCCITNVLLFPVRLQAGELRAVGRQRGENQRDQTFGDPVSVTGVQSFFWGDRRQNSPDHLQRAAPGERMVSTA